MRRSMLTANRVVVPPDIQFGAAGAKQASAVAALDIPYVPDVALNDGLLVVRVMWNDNMTANDIAGYTNLVDGTSGTGTAAGAHTTRIRMDFKVADSADVTHSALDDELATSGGGTVSGQVGVMLRYSNATGLWDAVGVGSSISAETTHGGNRAGGAGGNLDVLSGDLLVAGVAIDTSTALTMTAPAITLGGSGTGVGTKTIRYNTAGSTAGNDGNVEVIDAPYTGSSQTAAFAASFSSGIAQCGPLGGVRLRQA